MPNVQMTKKPFKAIFLHPKYWGIWLACLLFVPLVYLPLSIQFFLGKHIGLALYFLLNKRRQITLINLKLAFADKSKQQHISMAKEVFINQGIGLFETLSAWFKPQLFNNSYDITGLEHIKNAQNNHKAIILLGAHYTMLDLGGLFCSKSFSTSCVYRPQNNPLLEWFIFNRRHHIFNQQISSQNMRQLVGSIKNKEIIWYSPDQDFGLKQGVMAKFFGVPAATITAQRRLAKIGDKKNPPAIMLLHFYRTAKKVHGKPRYQLTITPALQNYPSNDEVADAQMVNDELERLINIAPTQWMWFHKRFKHNENGRSDVYKN